MNVDGPGKPSTTRAAHFSYRLTHNALAARIMAGGLSIRTCGVSNIPAGRCARTQRPPQAACRGSAQRPPLLSLSRGSWTAAGRTARCRFYRRTSLYFVDCACTAAVTRDIAHRLHAPLLYAYLPGIYTCYTYHARITTLPARTTYLRGISTPQRHHLLRRLHAHYTVLRCLPPCCAAPAAFPTLPRTPPYCVLPHAYYAACLQDLFTALPTRARTPDATTTSYTDTAPEHYAPHAPYRYFRPHTCSTPSCLPARL